MPDLRRATTVFGTALLLLLAAGYAFWDAVWGYGRPRVAAEGDRVVLAYRARGIGLINTRDGFRRWTPQGWSAPSDLDYQVMAIASADKVLAIFHKDGCTIAADDQDGEVLWNAPLQFRWQPEVAAGADGPGIAVVGVDADGTAIRAARVGDRRLAQVSGGPDLTSTPLSIALAASPAGWSVAWCEPGQPVRLAAFTADGWGPVSAGPAVLSTVALAIGPEGSLYLAGIGDSGGGPLLWRRAPEGTWGGPESVRVVEEDALLPAWPADLALAVAAGRLHIFVQSGIHISHLSRNLASETEGWDGPARVASMARVDRGIVAWWVAAVLAASLGLVAVGFLRLGRGVARHPGIDVVVGGPPREALASLSDRGAAFAVDLALCAVAGWVATAPLVGWGTKEFFLAPLWVHLARWTLAFAYFTACEALGGRTVGKRAVGIRVVGEAGERVSWGRAALRSVFRILDIFPDGGCLVGLVVLVNSQRLQRVGDLVARTVVVRDRHET